LRFIEVEYDTKAAKDFLKCEYNRDGDSYRSPWSNKYYPDASEEAVYPSADLLQLEQKFNDVFARYASLYFDQATTSVYLFDTDYEGFGGCFLVKKCNHCILLIDICSD
jgi:capping protein beta